MSCDSNGKDCPYIANGSPCDGCEFVDENGFEVSYEDGEDVLE